MSELGIYEGCYVQLRKGDVVGPVTKDEKADTAYIWNGPNGLSWEASGKVLLSEYEFPNDIVRVMPADAIKLTMSKTYGDFSKFGQAVIPPHVTKAAMDAGIKADPAYEQFVNAILTAGFKAQYGIEFVPVPPKDERIEELEDRVEGLDSDLQSAVEVAFKRGAEDWVRMNYPAQFARLAAKAGNESEKRIQDSEKPKGGLSDFLPFYEPGLAEKITDTGCEVLKSMSPLNGVTICFTGSMKMPADTHKGIAEALGAKVSGSVHSKTTLVVFGIGKSSKFEKAIEHILPRMDEKTWMWMAGLLGYGKTDQVSPYGKLTGSKCLPIPGTILRSYIVSALDDWANNHSKMSRAEYLARVMEKFIFHYVTPQNESKNRIPDSEKPKGGLSAIPSIREIHDEVLAEVRDWHAKYGRDSMPSTFSIAKAFHRMLTPVANEKPVHLVAPEGWYLHSCSHEHTAHRFADQTVEPVSYKNGAWSVEFQYLKGGGRLTGARGHDLCDAWAKAVEAVKQYELDLALDL